MLGVGGSNGNVVAYRAWVTTQPFPGWSNRWARDVWQWSDVTLSPFDPFTPRTGGYEKGITTMYVFHVTIVSTDDDTSDVRWQAFDGARSTFEEASLACVDWLGRHLASGWSLDCQSIVPEDGTPLPGDADYSTEATDETSEGVVES